MENNNNNPTPNSNNFGSPAQDQNPPLDNFSHPLSRNENTPANSNPHTATASVVPPESSAPETSPPSTPSNGKGSTFIVGGILLLFIIIVIALYFLILRQSYEPEIDITPPPIQQSESLPTSSPSPSQEELEVDEINIEESLDEDFAPIDEDLNNL